MAFKGWFRKLQPMQLYLVLFLTTAFFCVELITSHLTHALTLLVNAYHMLCNIIALVGCIASIKYSNRENYTDEHISNSQHGSSVICVANSDGNLDSEPSLAAVKMKQSQSDRRMKNTFGWARINILTLLVCCVFLASFCFSLQVEALQALFHIDHTGGMSNPLAVLCIGVAGIFLNVFCYILIGGYTFYHGSSLHVTTNGEVVIKRNITKDVATASNGKCQSSSGRENCSSKPPGRQGIREMCRDILGCVFVILVSLVVHYIDPYVGKFIDPLVAIVSSTSLFVLSYPYLKESGLILLQTIPNHINIDSMRKELLEAFPGIVNVHDLHVWQLTGEKTISTAHIMFLDPTVYASIRHQVTAFFVEIGITQVTIQPEFQKMSPAVESNQTDCLIRCEIESCSQSRCCSKDVSLDTEIDEKPKLQSHEINKEFENKEIILANQGDNTEEKNSGSNVQDISENDITCQVNVDDLPTSSEKVDQVSVKNFERNFDQETV